MQTIALRYGDNIAPSGGSILAHQELIDLNGFVWWGKFGARITENTISTIMEQDSPKILLINSGKFDRYWAYIESVSYDTPKIGTSPSYYWNNHDNIKTWFKITKFETAPKDVMSKCFVTSSGKVLSDASMHSMSPYFKITYKDGGDK